MSALRELTRVSPNLRKVAALLQSKGRNGDTILAHINPREAQMLLDAGGAGTTNPETGLLEFYDFSGSFEDPSMTVDYSQYGAQPSDVDPGVTQPFPQEMSIAAPQQFGDAFFQESRFTPATAPAGLAPEISTPTPTAPTMAPVETRTPMPVGGMTPAQKQMLTQLGVAGIQSIPALLASRQAAAQGRQATQQQQQIAQPYQQMGRQLLTQAQAGQLTPQGQQALQAARAQMAQGIQQRGGVGAQQAATQLEQFRQNLLQQQMDYGLKLSGIGDQIALGAIRSGIQADQYVNNLTQQFFSNLMRQFAPQPAPAAAPTPPGGR